MMRALYILLSTLSAALIGTLLLVQPGCKAEQCVQSGIDPNEPSPALECAAGLLCYQGQCITACNAGQEGAIECSDNGACDSARPNCVNGFCSACEEGESCVPTLNICQPTIEIEPGPKPSPPPPNAPVPPGPLEPGGIDGGLKYTRDAGPVVVTDQVITHAALVDVALIQDLRGGGAPVDSGVIQARVYEVGDPNNSPVNQRWHVDNWPITGQNYAPAVETQVVDLNGDEVQADLCSLTALTASTAFQAVPANLGEIAVDSHSDFPNSLFQPVTLTYSGSGYDVRNLTMSPFTFSDEPNNLFHFITISSSQGEPPTSGGWPFPEPDNGNHCPFRLEPAGTTTSDLQQGFTVAATPADLVVRFLPIGVGSVGGEKVVLRLRSATHQIRCDLTENAVMRGMSVRDDITIKASILNEFRNQSRLAPNTTFPIIFERAFAARLSVPPEPPAVIDFNVRVRHSLVGNVTFQ